MGRTVTPVGKPDAGNQHVRFDERGRETERALQSTATAPVLDFTKHASNECIILFFSRLKGLRPYRGGRLHFARIGRA